MLINPVLTILLNVSHSLVISIRLRYDRRVFSGLNNVLKLFPFLCLRITSFFCEKSRLPFISINYLFFFFMNYRTFFRYATIPGRHPYLDTSVGTSIIFIKVNINLTVKTAFFLIYVRPTITYFHSLILHLKFSGFVLTSITSGDPSESRSTTSLSR